MARPRYRRHRLYFLIISRSQRRRFFFTNKWVGLVLAATLLGTGSGLWDKVLLHQVGIEPLTLQVWFSIYLVPFFACSPAPFLVAEYRPESTPFRWRWTAALTGVLLIAADSAYFTALLTTTPRSP